MQADGKTCVPSLGLEGRMDIGSLLASFAPGLSANMDILAVTGGYASADTGLSLGMLGGGLGDPHNTCVPVVEAPTTPAIAQSKTFRTDVLPDNATPYHLGIGIHRTHLDTLGWSAFDAGALCLHVGTPTVALLSSKTIGLIIPSLQDLVHVGDAPMYIALRRRSRRPSRSARAPSRSTRRGAASSTMRCCTCTARASPSTSSPGSTTATCAS